MTTVASIASEGEAEQVLAQLGSTLEKLQSVIEQETALMRAGRLKAAMELESGKNELARHYAAHSQRVKMSNEFLLRALPATMAALREQHQKFHAELRTNQIVLATAHAVSEGIVRGVSDEMTRKASPSTYGSGGRANAPSPRTAAPIALSRKI